MNVLPTAGALRETLIQIRGCLKDGALFIANYPQSPRKSGFTMAMMEALLIFFFGENVKRVRYNSSTIWVIEKRADSEFAKHQGIAV